MSSIRFSYLGIGIALVGACATAGIACSSSDASGPPGGGTGGFPVGGAFGAGGAVPGGGGAIVGGGGATALGNGGAVPGGGGATSGSGGTTAAAGGGVSLGGGSSTADIKIIGSTIQCPGTTPGALPAGTISACSMANCSGAHCVPTGQLPPGEDTSLLQTCTDSATGAGFCVPDDFIATYGKFQVKKCTSLEGAEGRCISTCVPQVNVQFTTLPSTGCDAATERCAPCYNPIDGTDTKACSQGACNDAPTQPKVVFETCGGGAGVCVPPSLVPADLQAPLKAADDPTATSCTKTDSGGAKYLCAPTKKAADLSYQFPACTGTSIAYLAGAANSTGQKGACIPTYLIPVSKQGLVAPGPGAPPQDGCAVGELCAPCTDLTNNNAPTGACPP